MSTEEESKEDLLPFVNLNAKLKLILCLTYVFYWHNYSSMKWNDCWNNFYLEYTCNQMPDKINKTSEYNIIVWYSLCFLQLSNLRELNNFHFSYEKYYINLWQNFEWYEVELG